jgi:hypothetical protein
LFVSSLLKLASIPLPHARWLCSNSIQNASRTTVVLISHRARRGFLKIGLPSLADFIRPNGLTGQTGQPRQKGDDIYP